MLRSKNRPNLEIIELNDVSRGSVSFLSAKLRTENLLFLKMDEYVFPVFHDEAIIEVTIPLTENKSDILFDGIGTFKKARTIRIAVGKVIALQMTNSSYDGIGRLLSPRVNNDYVETRNTMPVVKTQNSIVIGVEVTLKDSRPTVSGCSAVIDYDLSELNYELNQNL
jgi:hypothetical protein